MFRDWLGPFSGKTWRGLSAVRDLVHIGVPLLRATTILDHIKTLVFWASILGSQCLGKLPYGII